MQQSFPFIPDHLISSVSIIIGAILGGIFSWLINKNYSSKAIETQSKIEKSKREYQEKNKEFKLNEYVNIIQLDICTALFQSLRMIKEFDNNKKKISIYPVPMNSNYAEAIVSLIKTFNLKEMSYIYQLYGIIEKLKNDTNAYHYDERHYTLIKEDCEMFIKKLYGTNFSKALDFDLNNVTYENLYDNEIIKVGYKNVLIKLSGIVKRIG
ncbi:hypothetical protein [Clostridium sp. CF012]|uniref:hypothetical protein n=1 Tax=Clostridium sp. CF012 TaxID=2843319 RepID=UPI001C0CB6FF|nr:hypothetical protein [Clostridium sp. CF012]MBU3143596.1 hypothetical protein [Clostridium sp. CF012]